MPGTRDLHDFLALHNPSQYVIMKVQERCYSGTLIDILMRIINASHVALPTVNHFYLALKRVKELTDNKKRDLQHIMCHNILNERAMMA